MGRHSSHDLFLDVTEIESFENLQRRSQPVGRAQAEPEATGEEQIAPEGFDPLKSAGSLLQRFIERMKKNWNS